jgi:hypothetical protein
MKTRSFKLHKQPRPVYWWFKFIQPGTYKHYQIGIPQTQLKDRIKKERIEFNYSFPEPATPAEDAKLIDWRFQAFTLTIQEVDTQTTPYTYSETYSQVEIIDTAKPKGKANRKALVFFALPII